jgi:hypothetical protein
MPSLPDENGRGQLAGTGESWRPCLRTAAGAALPTSQPTPLENRLLRGRRPFLSSGGEDKRQAGLPERALDAARPQGPAPFWRWNDAERARSA